MWWTGRPIEVQKTQNNGVLSVINGQTEIKYINIAEIDEAWLAERLNELDGISYDNNKNSCNCLKKKEINKKFNLPYTTTDNIEYRRSFSLIQNVL